MSNHHSPSTQSQEAIDSIDYELNSIVKKIKSESSTSKKTRSLTATDIKLLKPIESRNSVETHAILGLQKIGESIDLSSSQDKNFSPLKKSFSTGTEFLNQTNLPSPVKESLKYSGNLKLRSSQDSKSSQESEDSLRRSASLEKIERTSPAVVIAASLEKARECSLNPEKRDYTKVKYWLKIAQKVCQTYKKEEAFNSFLKQLYVSSDDPSLQEMLKNIFTDLKDI